MEILEFIEKWFNYIEAGFWAAMGCLILAPAFQKQLPYLRWNLPLAATLFAFGVTDLVEIKTGSWYSPWSLATGKIGCGILILSFFVWLISARRLQAKED
ncbi:MAG: hypothetical protein AAF585_19260 [Verrucomicrobiota bacterium]